MKLILIFVASLLLFSSCNDSQSANPLTKNEIPKVEQSLKEEALQKIIKVIDTDFSKGRLTNNQEITIWDIQKMHGHLCDGLIVGFLGLREGLHALYPDDSIIDRTNTRIVSKSSPCIGDVGLYLTGGRYQFNSYYIDNTTSGLYIVQRTDNNQAVLVRLKEGIKPPIIDQLGVKAIKNELDACRLDTLKKLEDDFSSMLLKSSPKNLFEIENAIDFKWNPVLNNDYKKTDILNKNASDCK
jgi:acetolactate decarboxylase